MFKSILIPILCVLCTSLALAQDEGAAGRKTMIQIGGPGAFGDAGFFNLSLAGPPSLVTGAPYSAQATTERVQILADGNRITQTSSGNVARDSQGRTRNEDLPFNALPAGAGAPRLVTINDPVAGYTYTLNQETRTAFKFPAIKGPLPEAGKTGQRMTRVEFSSGGEFQTRTVHIIANNGSPEGPEANETKTDLGLQTVGGVTAQGTRITRTIAAGAIGNQQPIVITTETWYSPDLKVVVMSKSSDPRFGETTYQLTNIQRSEPAASLFQIPSDYSVKEAPAKGAFLHQSGGTQ